MQARARGDRRRDRRLPDRPVQQHRHDRGLPALGRELLEQLDGRIDARRDATSERRQLPRHDAGPARAAAGAPPRRRRAGRIGRSCRGDRPGTHRIEGGGVGFVPPQLHLDDIDEVIAVPTATRVRDGPAGRSRRRRLVGTVDRREHQRRADAGPPARARARGSRRSRSIPGSSTSAASSTAERAARRARLVRATTAAGRAARGDVHLLLGHLLPVRRGVAVDRDGLPGAVRAAAPRARRRRRAASLRRPAATTIRLAAIAGLFFAGDLLFWHHAIEAVGAGLATVLGNLQVIVVGIVAWLLLGERPSRATFAGAAGRARRASSSSPGRSAATRTAPTPRSAWSSASARRSATRATCW